MKKEIDREFLAQRVRGQQPTLNIAGQTYFVSGDWNTLTPKDNFMISMIDLTELEHHHYSVGDDFKYQFPYDVNNHKVVELDFDTITAIPKGIQFIEIPTTSDLDPVGYARKHGWDVEDVISKYGLRAHHEAKIIPWDKTAINIFIKRNLKATRGKELTIDVIGKSDKSFFENLPAMRERQKTDLKLFEKRISGELPQIEIYLKRYLVDLQAQELRSVNDPNDRIFFRDLEYNMKDDVFTGFINLLTKTVIPGPIDKDDFKDFALLIIPGEKKLDPVGYARLKGLEDKSLLHSNPIQKNLGGVLIPLNPKALILMMKQLKPDQTLPRQRRPNRKKGKGL